MPPRRRDQIGHYDDETGRCGFCFEEWPCPSYLGDYEAPGLSLRDWEHEEANRAHERKKEEVRQQIQPLLDWAEEAGLEDGELSHWLRSQLGNGRISMTTYIGFEEAAWLLSIAHAHGAKKEEYDHGDPSDGDEGKQPSKDKEPF